MQSVIPQIPSWAANAVHGMTHRNQTERPDGLIIADDNLTHFAMQGLKEAGISVPQEIEVVSHCNYPCLPQTSLPVHWIGMDTRELLSQCARMIIEQRAGREVAPGRIQLRSRAQTMSLETIGNSLKSAAEHFNVQRIR
jgi:DNA-binding LacI/PurR family transcriptional regulator